MATNQSQRVSSSDELPEEMVREILVRLPPRHLLRCRMICQAWRRLATQHDLILLHHSRQPAQPLITVAHLAAPRNNCLEAVDLGTNKRRRRRMVARFAERFPHPRPYSTDHAANLGFFTPDALRVHASCDGLILLSFNDAYFVCNPATRQGALLPLLCDGRGEDIAGFYKHHASAEYRVLYHQAKGFDRTYYVLTLGSQEARIIEYRTSAPAVIAGLEEGLSSSTGWPPVLFHGSLHWPPQESQKGNMLVFNTIAESFRWIDPPHEVPEMYNRTRLFEMEGTLAMFCPEPQPGRAYLWFLADYEEMNWVRKHRVELSVKIVSHPIWFHPVIPYQEGDMLLPESSSNRVWHCDNTGQLQGSFECSLLDLKITPHVLKQSLVLHEFLQTQQNGAADEWLSKVEFADGLQ
ncbi:unnamed protein product [Alopecurus aequalis]